MNCYIDISKRLNKVQLSKINIPFSVWSTTHLLSLPSHFTSSVNVCHLVAFMWRWSLAPIYSWKDNEFIVQSKVELSLKLLEKWIDPVDYYMTLYFLISLIILYL